MTHFCLVPKARYPSLHWVASISVALTLLTAVVAANGAPSTPKDNSLCPDLSGHYRVAEFGDANHDALVTLRITMAGFLDSEVQFVLSPSDGYDLFIKSGSTGRLSTRPAASLTHGTDYVCRDGWLEMVQPVRTSRKTEQGFYEGQAVVRLNKAGRQGLTLATRFSGSQRSTFFQYDSARLSLPTPGTGTVLNESIRWPDISEPAPPSFESTSAPPEPPDLASARKRLMPLANPVTLATLRSSTGGVLATFKATRSDQVAKFEERLRDAGIGYLVRVQPRWSDNAHRFELLILPSGSVPAWRPSVLWVEQELQRTRHPGAEPLTVTPDAQGYGVTLMLSGGVPAQEVAQRIRKLSNAFADVVVQDVPATTTTTASPSPSARREARLLLVMK